MKLLSLAVILGMAGGAFIVKTPVLNGSYYCNSTKEYATIAGSDFNMQPSTDTRTLVIDFTNPLQYNETVLTKDIELFINADQDQSLISTERSYTDKNLGVNFLVKQTSMSTLDLIRTVQKGSQNFITEMTCKK